MKCPICGVAELIHDTRDVPYTYKGETTTIADVTADYCPSCGEAIMAREQGNRYSDAVGSLFMPEDLNRQNYALFEQRLQLHRNYTDPQN